MKIRQWYRFSLVCAITLLFACSSNERKDETSTQPSAASPVTESAPVPSAAASDLQMVHFDFDSYKLSKKSKRILKEDAAWLRKNPTEKVQIEGHCDERGSAKYNMKLGRNRATAVKNYLSKLGIKSSRLEVVSYGFDRPINAGHDEAAWAENRRAVPVTMSHNLSRAN